MPFTGGAVGASGPNPLFSDAGEGAAQLDPEPAPVESLGGDCSRSGTDEWIKDETSLRAGAAAARWLRRPKQREVALEAGGSRFQGALHLRQRRAGQPAWMARSGSAIG